MKAIELWWSRELLRIAQISRSTLHLLDDTSLAQISDAAALVLENVDRERGRRGTSDQ